MLDRNGEKWNREETILAYDLYCRTPFGKIHKNNPAIIELANILGRTPSSVGLKMANLAHFDENLKQREISAMAHGSKLDGEIYKEFCQDWQELAYQAQLIKANMQHIEIENLVSYDRIPEGKDKERFIKTRIGQDFFRTVVLNSYGNHCCITGISNPKLLVASHIKPWKVSNEKTERTNPSNGLCLNSLHDEAFDKGLITLDSQYRIIISKQMKNVEMDTETREWFWNYEMKQITLPSKFLPGKEFIEYHNDIIFQG